MSVDKIASLHVYVLLWWSHDKFVSEMYNFYLLLFCELHIYHRLFQGEFTRPFQVQGVLSAGVPRPTKKILS